MSETMTVQMKVIYYPKKHFWKFWEQKKPKQVRVMTQRGDISVREFTNYTPTGIRADRFTFEYRGKDRVLCLDRHEEFYPNGRLHRVSSLHPEKMSFEYDECGHLKELTKGVECRTYFKSGKLQSVFNISTNEYIEYTEVGALRYKKGEKKGEQILSSRTGQKVLRNGEENFTNFGKKIS